MKTRLILIAVLLFLLAILLFRNDSRIVTILLDVINPVKQRYRNFTQNIENTSHSYLFQKENIEKLSHENRLLRKRLLEQRHYLEEIKNIYDILPNLSQLPIHNIIITQTISYVKLNSFSQILLTSNKALEQNKLYGLIQHQVVAGIALVHNHQLFGYLTSDEHCRFSVFIGKTKAPGIAIGVNSHQMIIKFIPKWHDIHIGDKVKTSGLDNIFFANMPVGEVTDIQLKSSYKVAYIQTYNDVYHPKAFFLIKDASATLTKNFNSQIVRLPSKCPKSIQEMIKEIDDIVKEEDNKTLFIPSQNNETIPSSIPIQIDQTQEDIIEPLPPKEVIVVPTFIKQKKIYQYKKRVKRYKKRHLKVKKRKKKSPNLDLF